jgi:plasmid stabilization system protein ParE
MSRFLFTRKAEADLESICDYIGERNPKAADELLEQLEDTFKMLADSPRIGHSRSDLTKLQVRFWPVGSYLVIYKESKPLEIVRVLSGFRNLVEIL